MTAGPGDDRAAPAQRHGHLRASHADREQVVGTLKAAYVYGLVTKDEFDARVSQALASRTYAELALITADIPAGLAAAPPPLRPAPARADPAAGANLRPRERAVIAAALVAALAFMTAFFAPNPVAVLLALGAVGSALVSMVLAGTQMLASRRDRHSGGQLPPPRAASTRPATGQLPHASQPRRRSQADAARSPFPPLPGVYLATLDDQPPSPQPGEVPLPSGATALPEATGFSLVSRSLCLRWEVRMLRKIRVYWRRPGARAAARPWVPSWRGGAA